MTSVLQDVRFALRQLRRAPGYAATAVLTLALGIGATTAIFSLIYQVILRTIPIAHPEQLYKVGRDIECCVDGGLQNDWRIFSFDLYRTMRDHTSGTSGIAAVQAGSTSVSARRAGGTAEAIPLDIRFVSGNYFDVLGVSKFAGRLLTEQDDREGAPPVAVVSYGVWQRKFAGDPHLLGSSVVLTGHPVTVVGITAENFLGERNTGDPAGMWLPMAQEPVFQPERRLMQFPGSHWLDVLVRIPDAKQVPVVQLALQNELRHWLAENRTTAGDHVSDAQIARQTTELASASTGINDLRQQYEKSLRLLLLVAGSVLLIACANLANLMLVRGMARKQELSLRSALGAPRRRLIRQMLVEAVLLALFGGVLSLLLAFVGTRFILSLAMTGVLVSPLDATPSWPVLGFALGVSVLTGLLFGALPAWIVSRANPAEALRGASRSTRDAAALPQKVLVIAQAALSLAMLSSAGLLITSLRHLQHQDFRFEPEDRLLLFVDLQAAGYNYDRLAGLYRKFDDAFGHLPGIESFAYATYTPLSFDNWSDGIYRPGVPQADGDFASYSAVSAHFFETLGTHLLRGRLIDEHDTATSTSVAVVNATFAKRYFKDRQPLGEHFGTTLTQPAAFEIVGIVDDTKYRDPNEPVQPMFFTPITQTTTYTQPRDIAGEKAKHFVSNLVFHYRGDAHAASTAVRHTLRDIDPEISIGLERTFSDQLIANFTTERLVVRLTTLFGGLALLLAAVGLYGVTSYGVARRTGEIGIRMALGASRVGVLRMILRGAVVQACLGLLIGLPLCFVAGRLLQHTLYQTKAFQPLLLLAVIAMLIAAVIVAAAVPAQRAASINPTEALRTE